MTQQSELERQITVSSHPLASVSAFMRYAIGREEDVAEIRAGVESARAMTRERYDRLSRQKRKEFDSLRLKLALAPLVAGVPHIETVDRLVTQALRRATLSQATTQGGVVVEGEAGVGKTTTVLEVASRVAIRCLEEAFGQRWRSQPLEHLRTKYVTQDGQTVHGQYVPVLVVSLHGSVGPKIFLELTVKSYGSAGVPITVFEARARGADLADTLANLIASCGTVLVVIDEVHFLTASGQGTQTINYLKDLTNRTNAVFLVAGVSGDRKLQLFSGGQLEAQQQLSRRFKRALIGKLPDPIQSDELLDVLKVMAWKTVLLDDPRATWLTPEIVAYVYQRTGGILQHVSELIEGAAMSAIGSEREAITLSVLQSVQLSDAAENASPERKLKRRQDGKWTRRNKRDASSSENGEANQ